MLTSLFAMVGSLLSSVSERVISSKYYVFIFDYVMLLNFLCRNDVFLVNLDNMESYEVSLNDANNY